MAAENNVMPPIFVLRIFNESTSQIPPVGNGQLFASRRLNLLIRGYGGLEYNDSYFDQPVEREGLVTSFNSHYLPNNNWLIARWQNQNLSLRDIQRIWDQIEQWIYESQLAWVVCSDICLSWMTFLYTPIVGLGNSSVSLPMNLSRFRNHGNLCEALMKPRADYRTAIRILETLLSRRFTRDFLTVLECYATAFEVESLRIQFLNLFASLDGLFNFWAQSTSRVNVLDTYIAARDVQENIQREFHRINSEFVHGNQRLNPTQRQQLNAFVQAEFPMPQDRPIRRTTRQLFRDYVVVRWGLSWRDYEGFFNRMYELRNAFAHGGNIIVTEEEQYEALNQLTDVVTCFIIMELIDICQTQNMRDWRFSPREIDIRQYLARFEGSIPSVIISNLILQQHSISFLTNPNSEIIYRPSGSRHIQAQELQWQSIFNRDTHYYLSSGRLGYLGESSRDFLGILAERSDHQAGSWRIQEYPRVYYRQNNPTNPFAGILLVGGNLNYNIDGYLTDGGQHGQYSFSEIIGFLLLQNAAPEMGVLQSIFERPTARPCRDGVVLEGT